MHVHAPPKTHNPLKVYDAMVADGVPVQQATFNALISACATINDTTRAASLYTAMIDSPCATPDVKTLSALITVHDRAGDWRGAQRWWDVMHSSGIQPDTVAYNALLSALEKAGQADAALELFKSMRQSQVEASSTTYASLVEIFTQQGQWDQLRTALQVKEWLEAQGVDPEVC